MHPNGESPPFWKLIEKMRLFMFIKKHKLNTVFDALVSQRVIFIFIASRIGYFTYELV